MNAKTLHVLEFDKILQRLAEHTSFSAGRELALRTIPTDDILLARQWLAETTEARRLLGEHSDVHLGGVHDVRPMLPLAERGGILLANDLLEIRSTLLRARALRTLLTRLETRFANLADIGFRLEPVPHLADQIGQVINERGDVLDNASPRLARLRGEIKVVQGRLMERLSKLISSSDTAQYLQEAIVTQRQGRYVIPLRAEFKGRIRGLIHDQSASGATLFIEPFGVVELNNEWRKLQLDEQEEIRRLLAELSDAVGSDAPSIRQTVDALALLDLIIARARYADDLRASEPELRDFQQPRQTRRRPRPQQGEADQPTAAFRHPGSTLHLRRARHPLLDPDTVVPIDVYLEDDYFVILVTGPNTGGKTVTLKTVGLLVLMAQSGLHVPASDGSVLSCFESIFADIGDEQSIEQSLSTFSSHLTNIIAILDEAHDRSLVLLDELGAGTDPEEGSALARALLDFLVQRSVTTLATTHYSDLKIYAHSTPGVRNASVEFNVETLGPTYELSIGLPGRSNALAIAARLGLYPAIVQAAQALVRPESLAADSLLHEIKQTREQLEAERDGAEQARRQAEAHEKTLRQRLGEIEEARRELLGEAQAKAEAELEALADDLERVRRQLAGAGGHSTSTASTHQQMLAEAQQVLERRRRAAEALAPAATAARQTAERIPWAVGETAWIPSLHASGQIAALNPAEQDAEVQIGSFRMRLPLSRLVRREGDEPPPPAKAKRIAPAEPAPATAPAPHVGLELDVRGATVEEMLPRLEKYLDDAYLGMMPWVQIIHGKGTGALRAAVRNMLRAHPLVKNFREGEAKEGGDGVTIAYLVGQ